MVLEPDARESAADPLEANERDPVEVLAEEFLARHRDGKYPSISEYTRRHPELADQIEALFPAAAALEELKQQRHSRSLARSAVRPDRLGDYRIIREIGRGGMGIVYEAEQQSLGRHVALKVLPDQWMRDPKQIERFRRESQTAARLHHSNIVPVFGVGNQDDVNYYVMQYIVGRGLDEILEHLRRLAGPTDVSAASAPISSAPISNAQSSEGQASDTPVAQGDDDASSCVSTAAMAQGLLDGTLRPRPLASPLDSLRQNAQLSYRRFADAPDTDNSPVYAGASTLESFRPGSVAISSNQPFPTRAASSASADASVPAKSGRREHLRDSRPEAQRSEVARADTERVLSKDETEPIKPANSKSTSPSELPEAIDRSLGYWTSVARLGIQVAEALAYAHAQGVYHRDIKPGNLLLDAQGTVWVTDFGLAKAVAQDNLSRSGDIIGTLRYMAPEQLDGRTDGRSDIYSLGLTLYELLTFQPAFREEDRSRLIQQVVGGEIVAPRKISKDIPRDLETIVLKAVSCDPEHRYSSAESLAEDLHRYLEDRPITARPVGFVERTWRWSRRNPTVSSLSLAVVLLITVSFLAVTRQWRQARTESIRAEANLSLALDSMDEMLAQFSSNWMARPADTQTDEEQPELLTFAVSEGAAEILQRALSFYDRFAQQNATNPRLQRDIAKANRRIGDIHQRLGRPGAAIVAYQKAIEGYQDLATDFEESDVWAREAAMSYGELGVVLQISGRQKEAEEAYFTALRQLEELHETFPDSRETQIELARSHNAVGTMLWRSLKPGERERHHMKSLALLDELLEREPTNPEFRFLQALCYRSLSYRGRRSPVTDARQKAISTLELLVEEYPGVPDYRCELAEILATEQRFGGRDRREPLTDDLAEQHESQYRRALELASELSKQFPSIPRYNAAQVRALRTLAGFLQRREELGEAEQHYQAAIEFSRSLARNFPDIPYYQFQLGMAYHNLSDNLAEQERWSEAIDATQAAILQHDAHRSENPDNEFVKRFVGHEYARLADLYQKIGDPISAEKAEASAEELLGDSFRRERERNNSGRNRRRSET